MKKVCLFHFPRIDNFHGYSIDSLDPVPYFPQFKSRRGAVKLFYMLTKAESIDRMYRERDSSYMRFLRDFVDKFKDADLIGLITYNPIHPEVLYRDLPKPIKVLGFVDDPISTYIRGIPYLWAFDGAVHTSPSYNSDSLLRDALERWGCPQSYWWPLVPPRVNATNAADLWPLIEPRKQALRQGDNFFRQRDVDLVYVGAGWGPKLDRLVRLDKVFGSRLRIHGRWPLAGLSGIARGLKGKPVLWRRIRPISDQEKAALFYRTKIGLNMHVCGEPMDVGNIRMYEAPGHGMMLLSDKGGMNAHKQIFQPDKEAVFYDSVKDAAEKIRYYLAHDEEREAIARAGFDRVHRDYDGERCLKQLLDWAIALPQKNFAGVSTRGRGIDQHQSA